MLNAPIAPLIDNLKAKFPFEGYTNNATAPYYTVGNTVSKYLNNGDTLLDFGSGPCDKTSIVSQLGIDTTACDDLQDDWYKREDNTQKILDFALSMSIEFNIDLNSAIQRQYDMVMMNDVLEHIHHSPRHLLNDLVSAIKTNGYLFITVPNITNLRKRLDVLRGRTNLPSFELFYWYPGPWRGPTREYTRYDLEMLVEFLELKTVELTTVHHMLANLSPKLVAPYKLFTRVFPDLADTWLLVASKPAGWTPKKDVSDSEFSEIYSKKSKNLYE